MKRLRLYAIWVIGLAVSILISFALNNALPFFVWVVVILVSNSAISVDSLMKKAKELSEGKT